MPDLKKLITLEALQAALPSWLKSSSKPSYTADEISDTNTTNKFVTSADKSTWNAKGTYSKPTGGIPKSDLSQLVQDSLDLADSALQSESDPTVPSWAKQTNKPSYTQDEVTDGTTYKRVTSTEKSAWNNKQSALTTTQMSAVNSGIDSTKVGQISTNQSNILYNLNMGVKNLLNVPDGSYTTVAYSNPTTFSVNNGEMKVTTCTTGETRQVEVASITLEAGDYVLTDRLFGSGAGDIRLMDNGSSITTGNPATFTLTTTKTLIVRLYTYNTAALNTTIKPMLCTAEAYAQSTAYQPPALSNALLTKEAINAVNNGVKNLLQDAEDTVTSVRWIDYPISIPAGTYEVYIGTFSSDDTDSTLSQVYFFKDTTTLNPFVGITKKATGMHATITTNDTSTVLRIYASSNASLSAGDSITLSNVMVCKKEDWDASPVYVPYALPNYDLTRMVSELQKKAVKVYTYHVNPNESDPEDAVTYLDDATGLTPAKMGASSFSYGSWANAWFLPRPCVLKFDGTVDYYLNPNDYSKKTDGTASTIDSSNSTGNVMLEFPKIWVKRVNDGNGARTVSIAPVNVDGTYKCWSNINAEDKEVDHFYLPAYNGTIHSTKMRSLSGVTLNTTYAPNYTRAQEVTAATANNPTGKNMWYTETWADMCLVYDLLYLMGKSLDVQRTFGQGLSSGSETAMRAYVTGTHNAKGLFYGDISGTSTAVKVLGMENLWGCRWHGVAGLINDNGTLKVKMTYGVADGSTAVGYNTTGSGYLNYGSTYGTAGYVKKMQADNTMGYKIIETAGTDATYYCDYYYVNNSQSNYALFGGCSDNGAYCGFFVNLIREAARASWFVGGSLSCRP